MIIIVDNEVELLIKAGLSTFFVQKEREQRKFMKDEKLQKLFNNT
jgi:hypothetical protein